MAHMAYKDQPMLPPVNLREGMRQHLPMIVAYVTDQVLLLKGKADYKDDVYKILKASGFKNEEFTSVTQFACDYADYLIYHVGYDNDGAYKKAAINATDTFVARYLKQKGLIDRLPPGVKTYYSNYLTHYPDLAKKLLAHESSIKGEKGIKMSYYNQAYPQAPVYQQPAQAPQQQVFLDQNGSPFIYNAAGQAVYVQVPQAQPDPAQQHAYSMQRRNMRQQYSNQAPAAAPQAYGVAPAQYAYQQPVYQAAPTQPVQPFNGQFSGQRQTPPSNVQTYQEQTTGLGPFASNKYDTLPEPKSVAADPFTSKTDVYAPTTNLANNSNKAMVQNVVNAKPSLDEANKVRKADTGYESLYRTGAVWANNKLGLPLVYDSDAKTGVVRLNNNKQPINFLLQRKGGDYMDYGIHENVQFFKNSKHDAAPNKEETMRVLAEVQRRNFINEYLASTQDPEVEGNVTGSLADVDVNKPVILAQTIFGGNGAANILEALRERIMESEHLQEVSAKGQAMNFEYMYVYQLPIFETAADIALEFRKCETWQDILGVLRRLDREDVLSQMWCFINDSITGYINRLLRYQFGIKDISIDTFDGDILELVDLLRDEYEISAEFQRYAKVCAQSFIYPYDESQEAITETIGNLDERAVSFGIVYDVTYLPISSDNIFIPVPIETSIIDEGQSRQFMNECIVTKQSFLELYELIHSRFNETSIRTCFVLLLLMDGRFIYCHRTNAVDAYIISQVI